MRFISWLLILIVGVGWCIEAWAEAPWPCTEPRQEAVTPEALWQAPLPPVASVPSSPPPEALALIRAIASPQTSPAHAVRAIDQFVQHHHLPSNALLYAIFTATVREANTHRRFILEGLEHYGRRAQLLSDLLRKYRTELAGWPGHQPQYSEKRRAELKARIRWAHRQLDDIEDEQRLLCHRLQHLETKLRTIAQALQQHLRGQ